ncbi:MAG: YceI family protein [Nocardioidaceae bacterium]
MTTPTTVIPAYVAGTWAIDTLNSTVGFAVSYLGVAKVRGRFNDVTGEIVTADEPERSVVSARIAAASIDTGFPARDAYIQSADVLAAEEYTDIIFASTGVRAVGEKYLLDGALTIRGRTRPITLTASLGGIADDPTEGRRVLGVSAVTGIKRCDYGLSTTIPSPVIGANVRVELDIHATLVCDGED